MNKHLTHHCFLMALIMLAGCAPVNSTIHSDVNVSEAAVNAPAKADTNTGSNADMSNAAVRFETEADNEYVLQLGDALDVKYFYNPELNEHVTVRPDGKITLQLVGDISAAGSTPSKLKEIITSKYSSILRRPEITLIVKEVAVQEIYVSGEVSKPGIVPWHKGRTALQAIVSSGGFKETAYLGSVIIISKGTDNMPVAKKIDLEGMLSPESSGLQNDIVLKPFDVIYVPKTFIAKANKFVEQYIKNMIPASLSAGFSYTISNNSKVKVE